MEHLNTNNLRIALPAHEVEALKTKGTFWQGFFVGIAVGWLGTMGGFFAAWVLQR